MLAATRFAASPRATPPAVRPLHLGAGVGQRSRPRRRVRSVGSAPPLPHPTMMTTSPRAGIVPSAACSASSASVPRATCSCSLVSSRQTAAGRSAPHAAARSRSVAASRPGASNRTAPRSSAAIAASRSRRSRPERAMNPSNDQRGPATPQDATAASTDEAPGIATTVPPAAAQAATSPSPGSDTTGVPASVTSARSSPRGEVREQLALAGRPALRVVAGGPDRDLVPSRSRRVDARVLGGDQRHGAQHLERPQGHVAQVPDRRRDNEQRRRRSPVRLRCPPARPSSGPGRPGTPPRVQVVHPGRPRAQLRDRRHLALELRAGDHPVHALHQRAVEAERRRAPRCSAPVDPPVQQPVELRVARSRPRPRRSGRATGRPTAPCG